MFAPKNNKRAHEVLTDNLIQLFAIVQNQSIDLGIRRLIRQTLVL
jgi:hypothetical protein